VPTLLTSGQPVVPAVRLVYYRHTTFDEVKPFSPGFRSGGQDLEAEQLLHLV
jgi:hypothetical protein